VVPPDLNYKESTMKTLETKQMLRFRVWTAAAAITLLLLAGTGVVTGRSSAAPVAAKQTTIRFTVSEKGRDKLSGGQVLVTRASGGGTLTLADTPQAGTEYKSTSATGTIRFHGWIVGGGRVTDEANLSMDVVSGSYRFISRMQRVVLQTTVAKSDPNEKFTCPTGSTGGAALLDGKVKSQPDSFSTGDFCGMHVLDFGGTVGSPAHVVVAIKQGAP
jgi:hypothetical protein